MDSSDIVAIEPQTQWQPLSGSPEWQPLFNVEGVEMGWGLGVETALSREAWNPCAHWKVKAGFALIILRPMQASIAGTV